MSGAQHDDWEITHHTIVDEARDKDEEMTNLRKQVCFRLPSLLCIPDSLIVVQVEVTSRQLSMEMVRLANTLEILIII